MIERFNYPRIIYYDLFSRVFLYERLKYSNSILCDHIKLIKQAPITSEEYYKNLESIFQTNFSQLTQEYTSLFLLPFSSPIFLYLSHYKDACIGGESLLYVKNLLKDSGFFLNREISNENEDHLGILCLFMKFLLLQHQNEKANSVFENRIHSMAPLVIKDILLNPLSQSYKSIAKIFEAFIAFEEKYWCLDISASLQVFMWGHQKEKECKGLVVRF